MKTESMIGKCEQFKDMRIPYIENLLSGAEKEAFLEHLSQCHDCQVNLEETIQWADFLTENRKGVCPELWEVFETELGNESAYRDTHIKGCEECSADTEFFRKTAKVSHIPEDLWQEMTKRDLIWQRANHGRSLGNYMKTVVDYVKSISAIPTMALATVAATILMVLMLYPGQDSETYMGLSDVTWDSITLKRQLLGPVNQGSRIALLIRYQDVEKNPEQENVNRLYMALEPSGELADRYKWLTPLEVKEALEGQNLDRTSEPAILSMADNKLHLSMVVLLTISPENGKCRIRLDLYDTQAKQLLKSSEAASVEMADTEKAAKKLIESLLVDG